MIAPHVSRASVLANEMNYKYFFKRMNMFSTIEIVKGYSTKDANVAARVLYDRAQNVYNEVYQKWTELVAELGESAQESQEMYQKVVNAIDNMNTAKNNVDETDLSDNTVYILLIPDIAKRISSGDNYFNCDEKLFTLSEEEQFNILDMIENSGQKIITMENRLLSPKIARFSVNVNMKLWEGYNKQSVYTDCLHKLSTYFIEQTRKDMIPLSDITALFESVEGVDSVKAWFDADVENYTIYGQKGFYGIDEYGDIILTRNYKSSSGVTKKVRDVLPLIRGGFTSPDGVEYSEIQSSEYNSAFNMNITSYTQNTKLSLDNPID
jgi:hypothetical protein